MEALKTVIGDLVIVGIIAAFLEMLLPEGSSRHGVKLVFGLYFMAVLINPLVGFFSQGDMKIPDFRSLTAEESMETVNFSDKDVLKNAEAALAQEIAVKCTALYEEGSFSVEVRLSAEEINGVSIQCKGIEKGRERVVTDDLRTFVAKDYGVKKSKIEVIF